MDRSLRDLLSGVRLTPAQRRIAGYVVENRSEAAFLSSAELAERAGVSQPSVTRFVALLGFDGYLSFRRYLRAVDRRKSADGNKFQNALDADLANLTALRASLADDTQLREVGARLMASEPLVVIGHRVSAAQAASFGYFAAKIHPDVRVLTDLGSVLGDRIAHAHRRGARAAVVFAMPRYPRETATALTLVRSFGLGIVLITDKAVSPLTPEADDVLSAGVASEFVFDSHAAINSLSVALLEAMADAAGPLAQERLEAFEDHAAQHELFVPD